MSVSPSLVYQVDSFVGQVPIVNIFGAGTHCKLDHASRIAHVMELLVLPFQAVKYLDSLFGRWFRYVYLLKSPNNACTFSKISVVFGIGGAADKAHIATFEVGFQHVRGIHRAFARASCTHQVVYFVDVKDGISLLQQPVHHLLNTFFQVATILRSRQNRAHIHLIYTATFQPLRNVAPLNHGCQSIYQRCFTHARFAYVQRIVLFFSAKHLYGALQFLFATYQGIMILVCIVHTCNERTPRFVFLFLAFFAAEERHTRIVGVKFHQLGHKVCGVFAQLLVQQICRIRVFQVNKAHHQVGYLQRFHIGHHGQFLCVGENFG